MHGDLPIAQEHWNKVIKSVALDSESPDTMTIETHGGWKFSCNVASLTMPVHAQMSHNDPDVHLFELEDVGYVAEVEGWAMKYEKLHQIPIPEFARETCKKMERRNEGI